MSNLHEIITQAEDTLGFPSDVRLSSPHLAAQVALGAALSGERHVASALLADVADSHGMPGMIMVTQLLAQQLAAVLRLQGQSAGPVTVPVDDTKIGNADDRAMVHSSAKAASLLISGHAAGDSDQVTQGLSLMKEQDGVALSTSVLVLMVTATHLRHVEDTMSQARAAWVEFDND